MVDGSESLIAVVTVNWNGLDDTLACVESLRRVSCPAFDMLVVDNGSSDGSQMIIRERLADVSVLRSEENLGFAGGFNLGITAALAKGAQYILVLNNDTVVAEDFLGWLVKATQIGSRVGMVVPKIYYYHDPRRIWAAGAKWRTFPPSVKIIGYNRLDSGTVHAVPRELDYATGCAVLMSREMLKRVGLFDTSYFMYQEDYDFSIRVREAGYRIVYEPRSHIWHRVSRGLGENSPRKWYLWGRSLALFYMRHFSLVELRMFVGWVVLRESMKGNAVILPSLFSGLRGGHRIYRETRIAESGNHD